MKGILKRLSEGLKKTRLGLGNHLDRLRWGKTLEPQTLEELEELLITADLGVHASQRFLAQLQDESKKGMIRNNQDLKAFLKRTMRTLLEPSNHHLKEWLNREEKPFVILVIGVNGAGKTTTIGKLAHQFIQEGKKVLLAAGDTFRAAAAEQLEIWGKRIGADVVRQQSGSDPASVIFDALAAARARGVDIVIADTAGRLHTKAPLMEELKKIKRVMQKEIPSSPHEVLLVLDGTTGQNAISQARLFHEAVGVTGLVLTKLDGTAKGGIVIAIYDEMGIPIRLIGIGESPEDLQAFQAEPFIEALLGEGTP